MNPYQQYALAQQNPGMYREIAAKAAQARTGELAKNMFAQLAETGLDPNSKEYFQAMRQRALESGDENLFGMGQQQNQAQQGYAFDNPYYTSDIKEYIMTSGDTELQDKAALANFIQQSNRSKATNVSINNQTLASQPDDAYIPYELQKKVRDRNGNMPTKGIKYGELDGVNYFLQDELPTQDQQSAASGAKAVQQSEVLQQNFKYPKNVNNLLSGTGVRTIIGGALDDFGFPVASKIVTPPEVKAADDARLLALPMLTKAITGADATEQQKQDYKARYIENSRDTAEQRLIKATARKSFVDLSTLRAAGRLPDLKMRSHAPGVYVMGQIMTTDGNDLDIVSTPNGLGFIHPQTGKVMKIDNWDSFVNKAIGENK